MYFSLRNDKKSYFVFYFDLEDQNKNLKKKWNIRKLNINSLEKIKFRIYHRFRIIIINLIASKNNSKNDPNCKST